MIEYRYCRVNLALSNSFWILKINIGIIENKYHYRMKHMILLILKTIIMDFCLGKFIVFNIEEWFLSNWIQYQVTLGYWIWLSIMREHILVRNHSPAQHVTRHLWKETIQLIKMWLVIHNVKCFEASWGNTYWWQIIHLLSMRQDNLWKKTIQLIKMW